MQSRGNNARSILISENIARILQEGSIAALATLIEGGPNIGAKLLVEESIGNTTRVGSLGIETLDDAVAGHVAWFLESREETRVFHAKEFAPALTQLRDFQILFERIQREPRLVICGAGHVGASLARLASQLGYRATLIDDRAEFVARERFASDPGIELVIATNWPDAARAGVGKGHGVSVAIVTRGHSEDEQCLRAIIATEADYIGVIGSKRRTNIVLERLRQSGTAEEKLNKVHAPIGLDIGAVTPEEVALAIMAEIVLVRRGGAGGSLSDWRRRTRGKD